MSLLRFANRLARAQRLALAEDDRFFSTHPEREPWALGSLIIAVVGVVVIVALVFGIINIDWDGFQ